MRHQRARRTAARERAGRHERNRERRKKAKGRDNEARVGRALEALQEEEYLNTYSVSTPNDALDLRGIDAVMVTVEGAVITFQIKSSERGVQKHLLKHPEIPCLNVHDCADALDIVRLIRKRFGLSRKLCQ
jgi:hypothetical protein